MAEHIRVNGNKTGDEEQRYRTKRQDSQPLLEKSHAWDVGLLSHTETPFHPRMTEHADMLSRIPFSAQRHEFIMRLNNTYGLRYGQRLMESVKAQAKLTVSQPGDIYEQEADRVAEEVTRTINTPVRRQAPEEEEEVQMQEEEEELQTTPLLQRQDEEDEEPLQGKFIQRQAPEEEEELIQGKLVAQRQDEEEEELIQGKLAQRQIPEEEEELQTQPDEVSMSTVAGDIETRINSARGGGQPLADEVREPMEQAFGTDFSGISTHTDAEANMLNHELSAKAFTTGQDIFFRDGEYSPGSDSGRKLLAHELTHVVQQSGGGKTIRRRVAEEKIQNKSDTSYNELNGDCTNSQTESSILHKHDSDHKPDESVHRMAVVAADDIGSVADPLIWNNLEFATKIASEPVGDLTSNKVWEQAQDEASIRIVGHGEEGKIEKKTASQIVTSMTSDPTHTLPKNIPAQKRNIKEIIFQSCHAGVKKASSNKSLVDDMKTELERQGYYNITVKGRTGIAFGFTGMGGKTAETAVGTTYTWSSPAAKTHYTTTLGIDISQWSKGKMAYFDAMYQCRDDVTKSRKRIFKNVPQKPFRIVLGRYKTGYSKPWILAGLKKNPGPPVITAKQQWDGMSAKEKGEKLAVEMEEYWFKINNLMSGKGGFKTTNLIQIVTT